MTTAIYFRDFTMTLPEKDRRITAFLRMINYLAEKNVHASIRHESVEEMELTVFRTSKENGYRVLYYAQGDIKIVIADTFGSINQPAMYTNMVQGIVGKDAKENLVHIEEIYTCDRNLIGKVINADSEEKKAAAKENLKKFIYTNDPIQ